MNIGETLTINNKEYIVVAIETVDAEKYPNRAKYISATVYLKTGKRSNTYSTSISKDGWLNTQSNPVNCGKLY